MGLFGIVNLILYICNMEEIWKTIEDYPNYENAAGKPTSLDVG